MTVVVVVVAVQTRRCRRDLQPPGRGPEKQLPLGLGLLGQPYMW